MKSFKYLTIPVLLVMIAACGKDKNAIPAEKTQSGVAYEIVKKGDGKKVETGDVVGARLKYTVMRNDSTFLSNFDKDLAYFQVQEPQGYGDPSEWLLLMNQGDSAFFYLEVDSLYRTTEPPGYLQRGDIIKSTVVLKEAMTLEEYQTKKSMEERASAEAELGKLKEELVKAGINDYTETEEGLIYKITREGKGKNPQNGDIVTVHYVGRLFNGDTFDSSYKRGEPYSFTVGQSAVIKGWHVGLPYLKEGGKGTLYIPPSLGYGAEGAGSIPPNSPLIFDIEVLKVENAEAQSQKATAGLKAWLKKNGIRAIQAPEGYFYMIDEAGSGPKPQPGKKVKVHYTGKLLDGTVFDSSVERGEPIEFTLGVGQVIKGWDLGIQQFPVGSKGRLFIPPSLAYGSRQAGSIPPNSPLVFEIEVVEAGE